MYPNPVSGAAGLMPKVTSQPSSAKGSALPTASAKLAVSPIK